MPDCDAELCANWAGQGCACAVFDLEPVHDKYCECPEHILDRLGDDDEEWDADA